VDANPNYISALKQRANMLENSASLSKHFFVGDCNQRVHQVLQQIDKKFSVNLAVIDGFGVECHWTTIQALATCRRMDLIILFPQGMAINRNLRQWTETASSSLDVFFGTSAWREIYQNAGGQARLCIRSFLDLYQQNLKKLGYEQAGQVRELPIKSQKGQKLYYLIFTSRHPLGDHLWAQATSKSAAGQRRLLD